MNPLTIDITNIENPVELNGKSYVLVEVSGLSNLQAENLKLKADAENHRKEVMELRDVICSILDVLGLYDPATGNLKESIRNGDESYLKPIIKSIGDLMRLLTMSSFSTKSKSELEKKFEFIQKIFPIVEKYAR